ncbi:MAG: PTS sugar transporter subunit IIA [Candidatus Rariloculaceae bacterium]
MEVANILAPESVCFEAGVRSKKHALELLSDVLADAANIDDAEEVFESLVQRERLGCTGLGKSIAMPHTRLDGLEETIGAFIRLDDGVDFDAADGEPVDLIFGLLLPAHSGDEQIREVKELIAKLGDSELQKQLHDAAKPAELYNLLTKSLTIIHRTLTT